MKILLTTLNSKYIHSSLALRYLKSMCKDIDVKVDIKEFTINNNVDLIARQIYNLKPDVIGFSCYIWNINAIKELAYKIKLIFPDINIIFGGPEVSFDSIDVMKKNEYIDYIIFGEGEVTFRELVLYLNNENKDINTIDGLVYRHQDKIIKNKDRGLVENLDIIPSPYDDTEDLKDRIVYFESSRGCPFNCSFCLSSTLKSTRYFPLERTKRELKKLIDAKVRQVKFVDRTFNTNKNFAITIMKYIIKQKVEDINFHFEVTAHILDEEMLEFLKEVPKGLFQFEIGVQSTNDKVIKSINRTTDFEKLSKVVKRINSYKNIHQHLDLIAGLPYEGYDSYKKSFNDVYKLNADKLQMGFLKLLKGTKLREEIDMHGFVFYDKPPYEVMYNKYISFEEMSKIKEIEHIVEKYSDESYFEFALKFIINNFYNEPFDFFEDFAGYWVDKKYNTLSHSRNKLYIIIDEFYKYKELDQYEIFNQLIKYDYIVSNKTSTLPNFIDRKDVNIIQKMRHDFLKETGKRDIYISDTLKPVKKAINDIHIEKFTVDILELKKKGFLLEDVKLLDREIILLFKYLKGKNIFDRCQVFNITDEFTKLIEER
ncbi:B12-binding domain-containing radical SAM protein [Clostridiaceae bacterium M8S5]|nr:B12-binding domain-containing radical SAM protein [Clostridiaceae bacterium M8S5]